MEITEIKIFAVDEKRVKAYSSVVFDECFIVRDLKVIQGDNKLFVAMPSKKMKDGSYRDTVHPLNNNMRSKLETSILEAYQKELRKKKLQ
jgi:stage V sporulation protein G